MKILIGISLALLVCLLFSIDKCNSLKRAVSTQEANYNALKDTLHIKYNKDSSKVYSVLAMEAANNKYLLNVKDSSILELASIVKQYKNRLQSATNFHTSTGIHTISKTIHDTVGSYTITEDSDCAKNVVFESDIQLGQITDKVTGKKTNKYWITGHSIATYQETQLDLTVLNDYSVVIGYNKNKLPYAEVTTLNPFDTVKSVKVFDIILPKPSKWGLDVTAGYGILATSNGNMYHGIAITVGISRRIITFGRKR